MKIKDKKIIVLVLILVVFSIGYFFIVNKISYAFENDYNLEKSHNKTIEVITKCAEVYGKDNLDQFNDEGILYTTVQTLIDGGYLVTNEEGNIINSLNNSETLNNNKIRLKYENEKVIVEMYN